MTRISEEAYRAITGKPPKRSKYNNRKPEYYDPELKELITFDSVKEYEYYLILKDREKRGEIEELKRQYAFEIQPSFTSANGEKIQDINYIADFAFFDNVVGHWRYIDVKGYKTDVYRLKRKLVMYKYGITIEEVK